MDTIAAFKTAIEYETQVSKAYRDIAEEISDPLAKRMFVSLADDEYFHVQFLHKRLKEFIQSGTISLAKLATPFPVKRILENEIKQLTGIADVMQQATKPSLLLALKTAYDLEVKTTLFYKKMAEETQGTIQKLFQKFLIIEESHETAVQAQIYEYTKTGRWLPLRVGEKQTG